MQREKIQIPDDWGQDGLSKFLQGAHDNSILMFQHYRRVFAVLIEIDRLFEAIRHVRFPSELLPSFAARSWYAWRAATRLVTSGQVIESYSVMRASLECALYAHFISTDDSRAEVWLRRGASEDASREAKNMFTARAVKKAVAEREPSLGTDVERLYATTIDYGAHPNVDGHITAAQWDAGTVRTQDMIPGTMQWKVAVQHCRDIGICGLRIYEVMLGNRFRDAGLSDKLDALCRQIDQMRAGLE